jgi:hypothetical protein
MADDKVMDESIGNVSEKVQEGLAGCGKRAVNYEFVHCE